MTESNLVSMRAQWDSWFAESDARTRIHGFDKWQGLSAKAVSLRRILESSEFNFTDAKQSLQRAERTLNFARPYQIVVIGESGAGKSSLINALLEREILVTGSGGAVTGVATYVYPDSSLQPEDEVVTVVYRSADEFDRLSQRFAAMRERILAAGEGSRATADDLAKIDQTLVDLRAAQSSLEQRRLLGQTETYHLASDAQQLARLMDENSPQNAIGSSTRMIAGVRRIEYRLSQRPGGLPNCVVVDTPGLGARTLRHREILRDEIQEADAVVLVVNANRPEQQSDATASLIRDLLFDDYTPAQQNEFAAKVFLVVNRFDEIRTDADRSRLETSVQAIADLIAPDFLRLYGGVGATQRHFEMISSDGKRVALLRDRLRDFMAKRRLDLMVAEGRVQIEQSRARAHEVCATALREVNFNLGRVASAGAVRSHLVNQICRKRLADDRLELTSTIDRLFTELSEYRDSDAHGKQLRAIITRIRSDLRAQIDQVLPDLLSNLGVRTFDFSSGQAIQDTAENTLLLKLESDVRRTLEQEMEVHFARYYTSLFQGYLNESRLYDKIAIKSYGQTYIADDLNPQGQLKQEEERICNDYVAASRQILIYELIKKPIIESLQRVESESWKVITASDMFSSTYDTSVIAPVSTGSMSTMPATTTGAGANRTNAMFGKLRRFVGDAVGANTEETGAKVDLTAERQRDRQFVDTLREALGVGGAGPRDLQKIRAVVGAEFEQRTDNALKTALPHLETVFFYALSRFHDKFQDLVRGIEEEHLLHVNDPQANIQNILVESSGTQISRLSNAAALMAQLDRLSET